MAVPASGGTNPVVFTAAGQTLSGPCKLSAVLWDVPASSAAATCALREGTAASPIRVVVLRAPGDSAVHTVEAAPGVWARDLNVGTLTRGTVYVYMSPQQ